MELNYDRQISGDNSHSPSKEGTVGNTGTANESTERAQRDQWIKDYMESPPLDLMCGGLDFELIQAVSNDILDMDSIEERIAEHISRLDIIDRFCEDCWNGFQDWPEPDSSRDKFWRYFETVELEAAARKGCRFCSLVLQNMKSYDMLHIVRCIENRLQEAFEATDEDMRPTRASLWVKCEYPSRGEIQLCLPGKKSGEAHWCCSCDWNYVDSEELVGYEALGTLEIAKRWLRECAQDHAECAKQDSKALPTRLVCIADGCPYLVSTSHWVGMPPYATLSHCWGNARFLRLEQRNQDAFGQMIPFHDLPKTFQDAMDIAKALGLDYIWIDSLCIVQDDDDDWRKEASLMSSVYGGSYVNIAASSATNAHQGCHTKVNGLVDGLQVKVHVSGQDDRHKLIQFEEGALYHAALWQTPLASRAWVFQEKILSPRTIHFGDRGIYWECANKIASECLPCGLSPEHSDHSLIRKYRNLQYHDYPVWWAHAVRLYSAAQMTYGRDKLVAISGVARQIYERFGHKYIAGLWQDDTIERQLCWRVENNQTFGRPAPQLQPRPEYRAPSWSWASVDSLVDADLYQGCRFLKYARVLGGETFLIDGGDQFGQISTGWIRIACRKLLFGLISSGNAVAVNCNGRRIVFDVEPDTLQDVEHMECHGVYLLPLVLRIREPGDWLPSVCCGILLRPSGHTPGEFHRCGSFGVGSKQSCFTELTDEICRPGSPIAQETCTDIMKETEASEESFVITVS